MRCLFSFIVLCLLFACDTTSTDEVKEPSTSSNIDSLVDIERPIDIAVASLDLDSLNMVDVQEINPAIFVNLKYATEDNFMKMKLYERISKAYLLEDVAKRLGKCQDYLTEIKPGLHLLIYDAVRPVSVQVKMWKALDSISPKERGLFVSNPKNGSVHNYGAAVDLTICDENGYALDMGAGFDDIRKIAYPSMEAHFLSTGELTEEQVSNRKLLRKVMSSQGFINIPSEWWHFNGIRRADLKAEYQPLLEEF